MHSTLIYFASSIYNIYLLSFQFQCFVFFLWKPSYHCKSSLSKSMKLNVLNYWKQVGQMVSEVRITLFWGTIQTSNEGTLFLRSSPWSISYYTITDHKSLIQLAFEIFQIQASAGMLKEKEGKRKQWHAMSSS